MEFALSQSFTEPSFTERARSQLNPYSEVEVRVMAQTFRDLQSIPFAEEKNENVDLAGEPKREGGQS